MKSFCQIYVMLVFGVKYRLGLLERDMRQGVFNFIGKMVTDHGKGSVPLRVGGTSDHVHVLVALSSDIYVADLTREIKSRSSRWINENRLTIGRFAWQNGYGAFSYSQSALDNVKRYIDNQEQHHSVHPFREEIQRLIEIYDIISDPRDLPGDPI